MKNILGYTRKDPPLLTKEAAEEAKLSYFDRRRKEKAEAEYRKRNQFTNCSGRLRIAKPEVE